MFLDNMLDHIQEHFNNILNKVNKTIDLLRKLHNSSPKLALLIIHKSFIRPRREFFGLESIAGILTQFGLENYGLRNFSYTIFYTKKLSRKGRQK